MNKITKILSRGALTLPLVSCGPGVPQFDFRNSPENVHHDLVEAQGVAKALQILATEEGKPIDDTLERQIRQAMRSLVKAAHEETEDAQKEGYKQTNAELKTADDILSNFLKSENPAIPPVAKILQANISEARYCVETLSQGYFITGSR